MLGPMLRGFLRKTQGNGTYNPWFMLDTQAVERPHYAYCMLHAAQLAQKLGITRISAIEFGVAGGNGIAFMANFARQVERVTGVSVDIYGFDTGVGMPDPEGTKDLDLVTIILNYHDISYLPVDRAKMNARLFAALKPGGRLVIVDHAARAGSGAADGRTLHRIDEMLVRQELTQAGFVFDADGAFLRNPVDPRDKTSNDSPFPTDKFALRFVKPR